MNGSLLSHFLNLFCPDDAALITGEGNVLFLNSAKPMNYGTLGLAAQSVIKYVPLKLGEIALLNDPSSGGTVLGEFTFVMKIYDTGGVSLWLAQRKTLQRSFVSGKSIEEEGLRIPPTPIFQNGQLNEIILGAMQGHPLCPPDLKNQVTRECAQLQSLKQSFTRTVERLKIPLSKTAIQDYLDRCSRWAHEKVQEASTGDARVEVHLDDKELIRLHMDIHDGLVKMDFGGTSNSTKRFLTEAATYGVCFEALSRFYRLKKHTNAGSFTILQVTKPSQCLLNAKYPAPMSTGSLSVKAGLQAAISSALSQIHLKNQRALCAFAPVEIEVSEAGGNSRMLSLPGGGGGKPDEKESFHFSGDRNFQGTFGVEEWERHLPLKIIRLDYRNSGKGKGAHNGGRGLILKMEAREDMDVKWRTDLTKHRIKPAKNCSAGDISEISAQNSDGEAEALPAMGHLKWKKGSILIFASGSGGGWGVPAKAVEAD